MRLLPLVLAFFPTVILADEITLTSRVSAVTLYPQGAKIVRRVPFEAPAGQHELRLIDLPQGTPLETIRVKVEGAAMGAVQLREDYVPPAGDRDTPALIAAKDEVERLEEAVRGKEDEARSIRAAGEAADTRIAFLRQLAQSEALTGAGADTLRDVARMVGEETLAARQAAVGAEAQARAVDREVKDLLKALSEAQQALKALVPEAAARNLVAVSISGEAATTGVLEVSYYDWRAQWLPVYDASLDRAAGKVTLNRGALVAQDTGENWQDVTLELSTNAPEGAVAPAVLWPEKRWIIDPPQVKARGGLMSMDSTEAMASMEAPVIMEESVAQIELGGLSVTYAYPDRLSLASAADNVRLALGALSFDAEVRALAVPKADRTAFLVAEFTNSSGETILPSAATQLFRDGEYVGETGGGEVIVAGETVQLAFGPIEGLRLTRRVERNEGDVGVLSRSNQIAEKVEIEVENLTGETWSLRVLDQVPYSEQEDLTISHTARPRPSEMDVDERKGVMAWDGEIAPGAVTRIGLSYTIGWPDGKILQ